MEGMERGEKKSLLTIQAPNARQGWNCVGVGTKSQRQSRCLFSDRNSPNLALSTASQGLHC